MDVQEFARQFPQKMKELTDFVEGDDIKDIMGTEAVNHFKGSFENEGFTDEVLESWTDGKDVKRRDPDSSWYGHSGQTGKYSNARTTAKILTGETRELRESISYKKTSLGARITNSTPYAAVHQFGLQAKIYGKKVFQMTARPFMGKSVILKQNIEDKIYRQIKKIISK